ncbi:MAG: TadE family protein, partial [Anaerolineae bacterium]|nr:TadE family protein [Anaerolineae bacterium]
MNRPSQVFWKKLYNVSKGQSLVEMAITMPLLLLMLLGVFEVGWALRGYLVLVTANREAVRLAVKNGELDFAVKDVELIGYNEVLSHTLDSLGGATIQPDHRQLPLDFTETFSNASMLMSHFVIDTGLPCAVTNSDGLLEFDQACDCQVDDPDHAQWYTKDDLILHPEIPGYSHYRKDFGLPATTRLGYDGEIGYPAKARELALKQNQLNCTILKSSPKAITPPNNVFIAELFYDQPHLLGAPFISNAFTDPVPLYAHTAMRIVASRDSDAAEGIGPTCRLHPLMISLSDPPPTGPFPLQEGVSFQWVVWNEEETGNGDYLRQAMQNIKLPTTDYLNKTPEPDDTILNLGDQVFVVSP